MDFKIEALFTIDNPTPERLAELKARVWNALAAGARDVQVSIDFAASELLRDRR